MSNPRQLLEIPATITDRGQTTVPSPIRKMLALGKGGKVVFRGLADGTVLIAKHETSATADDPVVVKFLKFLAADMTRRPDRIQPVTEKLVHRGKALVKGVRIDLDAPLPDDEP